ncbi:DUF6265 family protein [uncultured Lutibacter sp.]|uniref:DUF6265 family protein n=1 Tax=uncultured Lutibacter sp. TaxID=437739 RepID=UPI002610855E|nr:DUF6265 family protein [uncultured Lutibacter sp.]
MKIYLAILFLVVSSNMISQNTLQLNDKNSPNASINDVSWIAGYWVGDALGGHVEEVWTTPLGDSMMGSFKLVIDEKVKFYEFCTISQENKSLILRIKHFNNDLKGWEEKENSVEFPLVKLETNKAYFDGLTFEKVSKDKLTMYVVFKNNGKEPVEMKFQYKLKK